MFTIRVNTRDLDRLLKKVEAFEISLQDATPLWRRLLTDLREYEESLFSNQGEGKWPFYTQTFSSVDAAQQYMNWKDYHYPGSSLTLLQLSGRLKKSLTGKTPDSIVFMHPKRFAFGTRVDYAVIHNQGREPVAQREFLGWNPSLQSIVKREARLFADQRARRFFK